VTFNLGRLRSAGRAAAFGAWTLVDYAGVRIHQQSVSAEARYDVWQRWMRAWTGGLIKLFGVEPVISAERAVPLAQGARLVVANHRSPLDIALMLRYFGGHVLSREDLANWPFIGLIARKADTIFVDRQSALSGLSAIRQIRQRLRDGRTVIIFPEGATFQGDQVRDFHAGAFAAVRRLKVELVPVGIAYEPGSEFFDESFVQHFQRITVRPKTRVSICFGKSSFAQGSAAEIAAEMQRQVQELVKQARGGLPTR
jgi:1-acyl-sn-glycerol-3-phosphate acyltransferase